jgi:hypothetical protein
MHVLDTPMAESGGPSLGSDESVAMRSHRAGGSKPSGPRQRPRPAALSGSQTKAPGFAGGYLLSEHPGTRPRGAGLVLPSLNVHTHHDEP